MPHAQTAPLLLAIRRAVPAAVLTINQVLGDAGYRCWLVGGCVRDLLRTTEEERHTPQDWDLATDATPEQVQGLFRKVIPTGVTHGTVTVVLSKNTYELTTLRGERGYSDGRHPDEVFFVTDIARDLARRDFTVNAIAYDLSQGELIDPFDGRGDLERGVLRAVGDPQKRFEEDGLRVMRCARFASTLELDVEPDTQRAMRPALASFRKVAVERIREEWFKALSSKRPSRALRLMQSEGLMEIISQPLAHALSNTNLKETACDVLDSAAPDPLRRLALLCCLTGGSLTPWELSSKLASHLKLSGEQTRRLSTLTRSYPPPRVSADFSQTPLQQELGQRRWLRTVGRESAEDVLTLCSELPGEPSADAALRNWVQRELSSDFPLSLKELRITGGELLAELAAPPGPWVGAVLEWLMERTLEDPAQNERSRLIELARAAPGLPSH